MPLPRSGKTSQPRASALGWHKKKIALKASSTPLRGVQFRQCTILQYSKTPSLRSPGFEDEDDDEDENEAPHEGDRTVVRSLVLYRRRRSWIRFERNGRSNPIRSLSWASFSSSSSNPATRSHGVLECWSTAPIWNCTPRTRGWECFQGGLSSGINPGLKPWADLFCHFVARAFAA
jgi:hypothetical protein